MSLYSLPQPSGFRALPSGLLTLDARSPYLLQGDAPPAQPGEQQPFPSTAAALIAALGATGVILPANVLAIYQCDTASPLVDSLGLGPNLVAGGGPLTGRECVGLGQAGSFTSKVGCELPSLWTYFERAVGASNFANPNGSIVSILVVYRMNTISGGSFSLVSHWDGGVTTYALGSNATQCGPLVHGAWVAAPGLVSVPADGSWHSAVLIIDDIALTSQLLHDVGDGVAQIYVGSLNDVNARFAIGSGAGPSSSVAQIAYVAVLDRALTSAMRATFWRAFNLNEFNTPVAYTRANPLVTRITQVFGNVACYGANQPAVGYAANASAGDNALKTGLVCEDGASFLGLGTDNMPAWVGTNATVTPTDGPSGMRDACRVADTDGVNAGYATSGSANLVGATNVPFIYSAYVKSGGVGTNAVYQSYYTGDGGGPETFTNWTIAGAVGAAWRPFAGLTHTPVGVAHTAVVARLIPTDNVGASLGTVDFAEVWGVQNSAVDRLAWRRVAAGAAAATGTPTLSYTNVGNARYNPARGRIKIRISDFAGSPNIAFFFSTGVYGAAGTVAFYWNGGAGVGYLEMRDTAAALVVNENLGAIPPNANEHVYTIEWNAAVGTMSIMEGATVIAALIPGPWVPEPLDVTPILVGSNPAFNAGRCHVTLLEGWDF